MQTTARSSHLTPVPQGVDGYDECWYPIALSDEVGPGEVLGRELFDGKVVVFRTPSGGVSVVSAYCRHVGADLSDGAVVDDCLRCPFHHWSYDTAGVCVRTASGDRTPKSSSLFKFPTAERWGLIWAFNGPEPTFDVPGWPEPESERHISAVLAADYHGDPFTGIVINAMDVQHLRTLHGVEITDVEMQPEGNWLYVDMTLGGTLGTTLVPQMTRRATAMGPNTVVYSKTTTGIDTMAAGAPYRGRTRMYLVTAALRSAYSPEVIADAVADREEISMQAIAEDLPILDKLRYRADTLTTSDRAIAALLQWVAGYPRVQLPEGFIN